MSPLTISILVVITSLCMLVLIFRPLKLIRWYFIIRPCVSPFAGMQYTLFGLMPIAASYPILLLLGAVMSIAKAGGRFVPANIFLMYFMVILSIPSVLIGPSLVMAIDILTRILSGIAAFLITYNSIKSDKDVLYFLRSLVYSSIIPIIYGFYQYITKTGNFLTGEYSDPNRVSSVFGAYNAYGEYLNIIIFTMLGMIAGNRFTEERKKLLVLLCLVVAQSLLAQNRGAWLGLIVGLGIAIMIYPRVFKVRWLMIGGLVLALAGGAFIIARFDNLHQLSKYGSSQNTLEGRLVFGEYLLTLAMENPLTGKGLGYIAHAVGIFNAPHNDYLWIFLETGALSLACFITFILTNIFSHLANRKTTQWRWLHCPMAGLSIYLALHLFFQNIFFNTAIFPFFMAILGLAAKVRTIQENPNGTPLAGGA